MSTEDQPPDQPVPPPPVDPRAAWQAQWQAEWAQRQAQPRRLPVRPSPVFLGLVLVMIGAGVYLWQVTALNAVGIPSRAVQFGIFVFVFAGWVVSLCLHEFCHAAVAWKGGDRSVEAKGYLTLDPRRYMDRQLSIVLPIIIVAIGGIALPGGAVMIDRRWVPSKAWRSLISAAGPMCNLVVAGVCAVPLATHSITARHAGLAYALAFLAFLNVAATILNTLPIPGLDGFGIISPFLKDETVRSLMPISQYVFFGMLVLLFVSTRASAEFFRAVEHVVSVLGVNPALAEDGGVLFRFWQSP